MLTFFCLIDSLFDIFLPQSDFQKYCSAMRESVQGLWDEECNKTPARLSSDKECLSRPQRTADTASPSTPDTLVFPTLQMGDFGITNDSYITKRFLSTTEEGSTVHLASGYFNLTEEYMKCVLGESQASYSILMAHPEVR